MEDRPLTDNEIAQLIQAGGPALQRALTARIIAEMRLAAKSAGLDPDNDEEMDALQRSYLHEVAEEERPNLAYAARRASFEVRQRRALEMGTPQDLLDAGYAQKPKRTTPNELKPEDRYNDTGRAIRNFTQAYETNEELRHALKTLDQADEAAERERIFGTHYEEDGG